MDKKINTQLAINLPQSADEGTHFDTALWNKLLCYQLGGATTAADRLFIRKLKQQTGWSTGFCNLAIVEYKRFIYLAKVSPTPVTPSKIVDQVWHLHLTFTRCYWQDMCEDLLHEPIHHEPDVAANNNQTQQQYQHTLNLYQRHFGHSANARCWPTEKPSSRWPTAILGTIAAVGGFNVAMAAETSSHNASFGLGWIFAAIIGVLGVTWILKRIFGSSRGNSSGSSSGGFFGGGSGGDGGGSSCGGGGGCGS